MNPITLQIISNAIVLLGVLVAIGTIIYNVRTAKKTQTATFFLRVGKICNIESLHTLKQVHRSGKSFRSYVFPCDGCIITDEEWPSVENFNIF
ncbi:hypothetical protein CSC07_5110 [Escherichia coli]|nr:DUF4760 domain-containing protein [Escherichia coli]PRW50743.1 hypothetical protein CSC07_5110 [Escherichia coli]